MLDATAVRQLVFSDLYLGHPTLEDRFCDVPGAGANPLRASAALRDDLDEGRLVHLPLAVDNGENYPIYLIQRADTPPGQAGRWLAERFAQQLPLLVQGF